MTTAISLKGPDRLLAGAFATLLIATAFLAASNAHLLCSVYCIHSVSEMAPTEICSRVDLR